MIEFTETQDRLELIYKADFGPSEWVEQEKDFSMKASARSGSYLSTATYSADPKNPINSPWMMRAITKARGITAGNGHPENLTGCQFVPYVES
jgi:hypothetical protein